MSITDTIAPDPCDAAGFARHTGLLPALVRADDATWPCRIGTLSAFGVELDLTDATPAGELPVEAMIDIPSLGIYRARKCDGPGESPAYFFTLTEFSRRALDALIRDRFGI